MKFWHRAPIPNFIFPQISFICNGFLDYSDGIYTILRKQCYKLLYSFIHGFIRHVDKLPFFGTKEKRPYDITLYRMDAIFSSLRDEITNALEMDSSDSLYFISFFLLRNDRK